MNAPFAPERDDPTTVSQVDMRDDAAALRIGAFVDAHPALGGWDDHQLVPVCYGGTFAVRRDRILSKPPAFWRGRGVATN